MYIQFKEGEFDYLIQRIIDTIIPLRRSQPVNLKQDEYGNLMINLDFLTFHEMRALVYSAMEDAGFIVYE